MATQGLISIISGEKVIMKIIAGCNGDKAKLVAKEIKKNWPLTAESVYYLALKIGLGSQESLVVLTADDYYYYGSDDLSELYRQTFDQPNFNPRWEHGTSDYFELVEV